MRPSPTHHIIVASDFAFAAAGGELCDVAQCIASAYGPMPPFATDDDGGGDSEPLAAGDWGSGRSPSVHKDAVPTPAAQRALVGDGGAAAETVSFPTSASCCCCCGGGLSNDAPSALKVPTAASSPLAMSPPFPNLPLLASPPSSSPPLLIVDVPPPRSVAFALSAGEGRKASGEEAAALAPPSPAASPNATYGHIRSLNKKNSDTMVLGRAAVEVQTPSFPSSSFPSYPPMCRLCSAIALARGVLREEAGRRSLLCVWEAEGRLEIARACCLRAVSLAEAAVVAIGQTRAVLAGGFGDGV